MDKIERPTPIGKDKHGIDVYDGRAIAAYRMTNALTMEQVADRARWSKSLQEHYEVNGCEVQEDEAVVMLDAIDFLAAKRARMIADGYALFASLKDAPPLRARYARVAKVQTR